MVKRLQEPGRPKQIGDFKVQRILGVWGPSSRATSVENWLVGWHIFDDQRVNGATMVTNQFNATILNDFQLGME